MTMPSEKTDAMDDMMRKAAAVQGRSLWQDGARRFFANRAAMTGLVILGLIALFALIGPALSPYPVDEYANFLSVLKAPSLEGRHWFGTDALGRDMFVRTAYGARISLMIGVVTSVIAISIGILYGATAGFIGGRTDNIMMRIVDVLYALPLIFLIIILVTVFGRKIFLIFIAIGAVEWLTMARIVRGQTLAVKQKEFVEAAYAAGVSRFDIIRRHILPNVIGPVIVYVTLLVPTNILIESYLSFLGLGVQEPLTSWGALIKQGTAEMETSPWLLAFPATFLAVTMFCFNFIGDGLRDALDPKDR